MTTAATSTGQPGTNTHTADYDVEKIRRDFPILRQTINDHPLVYLDNAATTQKPQAVIDALRHYYETDNANIHRGVHELSVRATEAYEKSRVKAQRFINAGRREEIIFTRGTTEAINLVAQAYARPIVKSGDEILITAMEHHSNIVPWQLLCEQTGAVLRVAPINDRGELLLDEYEKLIGPRTKVVAVVHISNALGTVNPIEEMIAMAHRHGAVVVIDGAQAAPHLPVDVRALDCDFYALSSHKLYGPTGIGVLYGKQELLENMSPYQGGGDMIKSVTFEKTVYNDLPFRFEAGTPNIAGTIAFGAALDYVSRLGFEKIDAYEAELLNYATAALSEIPEVRLIGTAARKVSVLSFVVDGVHAHDVGTILDQLGIAVRTGHHCAQPVMKHFGLSATARASIGLYNTKAEIDALVAGVRKVVEVFG
ncbi:MAG: cysteine desulfurase [Planctomycetota bacterium]|nr:cysteine desulfurase [Planctomycetota bacterium]